jgi:hypothetical protein
MIQILVQLPLSCRQEEDVLGSRVDAPKNLIADPRARSRTTRASEAPALSLLYARKVTR